jgi:hypothetical protein
MKDMEIYCIAKAPSSIQCGKNVKCADLLIFAIFRQKKTKWAKLKDTLDRPTLVQFCIVAYQQSPLWVFFRDLLLKN